MVLGNPTTVEAKLVGGDEQLECLTIDASRIARTLDVAQETQTKWIAQRICSFYDRRRISSLIIPQTWPDSHVCHWLGSERATPGPLTWDGGQSYSAFQVHEAA